MEIIKEYFDFILCNSAIFLMFFYGAFDGLMDISSENNFKGELNHLNKSESWKNKWYIDANENPIIQEKKLWYYLYIFTPVYVELFPYSSTLLVWLTDFWHRVKFYKGIVMLVVILIQSFVMNEIHLVDILVLVCMLKISVWTGFYTTYTVYKNRLLNER